MLVEHRPLLTHKIFTNYIQPLVETPDKVLFTTCKESISLDMEERTISIRVAYKHLSNFVDGFVDEVKGITQEYPEVLNTMFCYYGYCEGIDKEWTVSDMQPFIKTPPTKIFERWLQDIVVELGGCYNTKLNDNVVCVVLRFDSEELFSKYIERKMLTTMYDNDDLLTSKEAYIEAWAAKQQLKMK